MSGELTIIVHIDGAHADLFLRLAVLTRLRMFLPTGPQC